MIGERTKVRRLPATTIARTLLDLIRRLSPVEHLVLADQALKLGLGRHHDLAEPAESPMETRLRWLLIDAGLPGPQVQVDLHNASGRFVGRADLYYPQARLVIEYDGANHRDRMTEDLRRQNAILSAGFRLLRFTFADVNERPHSVAAQVRNALVA
jgi:very-short-patch-repair endonuclease